MVGLTGSAKLFSIKRECMKLRAAIAGSALVLFAGLLIVFLSIVRKRGRVRIVTIAESIQPIGGLFHIADAQGFFKKQGIDPQFVTFETGRRALEFMLGGEADFATAADTPIARMILNSSPVKLLATTASSGRSIGLVVNKDIVNFETDLKGKHIGTVRGTVADFYLQSLLTKNDIAIRDLKIHYMQPSEIPEAMANGEIAGAVIWKPILMQIKKRLGDQAKVYIASDVHTWTWNLVGTTASDPSISRGMIRALMEAEDFLHSNYLESLRIIAARTHLDQDLVLDMLGSSHLEISLDQSMIINLESQVEWFAPEIAGTSNGELPNVLHAIDLEPLAAVDPTRVGVIR
jgi:ABC-type nitrate/sulfonate/bicarbonate transport system substrate-binding protein